MLSGVFDHEAQPPPYFILAWLWVKVFGDGEIGLRSLSALLGTLTIPVAYEAAKLVAGRRVAIAVGALTALSPPLVWYSQEARAYALVAFLGTVALLFFLRALRAAAGPRPPGLGDRVGARGRVALLRAVPRRADGGVAAAAGARPPGAPALSGRLRRGPRRDRADAPLPAQPRRRGLDRRDPAVAARARRRLLLRGRPDGRGQPARPPQPRLRRRPVVGVVAVAAALAWWGPDVRRRLLLVLGLAACVVARAARRLRRRDRLRPRSQLPRRVGPAHHRRGGGLLRPAAAVGRTRRRRAGLRRLRGDRPRRGPAQP